MRKEKLRIVHLEKRKANGTVLQDINLNLYEGEVLGVLGLHEAGKSTLLDIIAGRENFDGGTIFLDEEIVKGRKMPDNARVALVKRRSSLVGSLSVAENIFVLRRYARPKILLRRSIIEQQTRLRLGELNLHIDPGEHISRLTDIESYIVEIVKASILGVQLILIDDFSEDYPINAYTAIGQVIDQLKTKGISFVVTGSQWSNLSVFCDRIAILDRKHICKVISSASENRAVAERVMLGGGEAYAPRQARTARADEPVAFEARNLSGIHIKNLSFSVHQGEVVALYDPRKRALEELYALLLQPVLPHGGTMSAFGKPYDPADPSQRAVVTEFNMEKRFMSRMSVRDNLCLSCYPRLMQLGVLREHRVRFVEREFVQWYGNDELIGLDRCTKLSEREKTAIYLFTLRLQNPRLIFCADPGIAADFAVSQMIYKELHEMAERGTAVLMLISSSDWIGAAADRVCPIPPYSLTF